MSLCVSLANSTACPDFAGFSAFIDTAQISGVSDLASFDNYIETSITTSGGFATFAQMETVPSTPPTAGLNCTGFTGRGLRYHREALCAILASQGSNAQSGCGSAGKQVDFCASTVKLFVDSFNGMLVDGQQCPSPNTQRAAAYIRFYSDNTANLVSNGGCRYKASNEKLCGFSTTDQFNAFCAASATKTDPCCSGQGSITVSPAFIPTLAPSNTAALPPTNSTDSSTAGDPSRPFPIPAIATAAGVALILVTSTSIYLCSRRNQPREFVTYGSDKDLDNGNVANGQRISMERLDAARAPMGLAGANASGSKFTRPMSSGKQLHNVLFNYYPTIEDELVAYIGDKILIKAEYDDGWAYGGNLRTMQEGFFPIGILGLGSRAGQDLRQATASPSFQPSIINNTNNNGFRNDNSRTASIYGARVSSMMSASKSPIPSVNLNPSFTPITAVSPMSTPAPSIPTMSPVQEKKLHIVAYDFVPSMNDEIELRVGDQIDLQQEFDDGWGFGFNTNTQLQGVLPLDCLLGYGEGGFSAGGAGGVSAASSPVYGGSNAGKKYGSRTSSILGNVRVNDSAYGYQPPSRR
ncbi:hypothetical protein HDU80_009216 [Chytriomyces hyalinus]|nr:hypothetical protein HDU80_009216 [Chytriomyces hyalinus]